MSKEKKVYTKKGDCCYTQLIGGKIVPKNNLRIDAYGTIDELVSFVGLLKDFIEDSDEKHFLQSIQEDLFCFEAFLACDKAKCDDFFSSLPFNKVKVIEERIDQIQKKLPELNQFIIPGGAISNSLSHICRTVTRRTERSLAKLNEIDPLPFQIMQYFNRLSDYFFVLARMETYRKGLEEIKWKGFKK